MNVMIGHTGRKHTVTDLLRQRKRRPFAAAISELGVFNNRFAPTGRWRPPFVDCPCQQPRAAEPQGDADDADAQ